MIHVVDTHALAWYLSNNPKLGSDASAALSDHSAEIVLPTMVLGELCGMIQRGRTPIGPAEDVLRALIADPRIRIVNLDLVRASIAVPHSITEIHDRLIVATAKVLSKSGAQVALITADAQITASAGIAVIWQ